MAILMVMLTWMCWHHVLAAPNHAPNNALATSGNSFFQSSGFFFNNPNFGFSHDHITCPVQVDQSAIFRLSNISTGYPGIAIEKELLLPANFELTTCLLREVVLPNAPTVAADPSIDNAQTKCPETLRQLWNFQHPQHGRCWIMQNFQESIWYSECQTANCLQCKSSTYYNPFNYDFNNNQRSTARNRCVRSFNYVSVWAFCLNLPLNSRVTRERIIIPQGCQCRALTCTKAFHKKK